MKTLQFSIELNYTITCVGFLITYSIATSIINSMEFCLHSYSSILYPHLFKNWIEPKMATLITQIKL